MWGREREVEREELGLDRVLFIERENIRRGVDIEERKNFILVWEFLGVVF